jgi:iron complex outermembrane receptor protein
MTFRVFLLAALGAAQPAFAQETAPADLALDQGEPVTDIVVTARRRSESLQEVPLAIAAVDGATLDATGAFNIQRLQQLAPTVNFYSSNPRNTAIIIRGLGAPFGLTNDGIEQGVGLYIDQVYYSRPAAASFDFIDVERVEVLRGPQGTLYGKNTTSGAIAITTRAPSFETEGRAELSFGNFGFVQAKGSVSGPLKEDRLAIRVAAVGTKRNGTVRNAFNDQPVQEQDNIGGRVALLWTPRDDLSVTFSGDYNRQDPECCGQVFVRVAPTLRNPNRQFEGLAAASGYQPPSRNPFDRVLDADSPLDARQKFGGGSVVLEWERENGTLTSVTAFRFWDWFPSNDRDFTSLPITTVSANPSQQDQWTQEFRYSGGITERLDFVAGLFLYNQKIESIGQQEQGSAASLWLLGPVNGSNPALLDGLRQDTFIDYSNTSIAGYGEIDFQLTPTVSLRPGLRLNWDEKTADYDAVVTGGLPNPTPAQQALKNSILQSQAYEADFSDFNVSGGITASWQASRDVLVYGTYGRSFKPGGVNLSGIPNDASGQPALGVATVDPESVNHLEMGVKTQLFTRTLTANFAAFRTTIDDYQATVVNNEVGVLRGFLSNAERVRVQGIEFDGAWNPSERFTLSASAAFLDGRYVSFPDAPCPVELTGGPQVCDVSGQRLPGVSRWQFSANAEYRHPVTLVGAEGEAFLGLDLFYRSNFSTNPSPSDFMFVDGYALVNPRLGFRTESFDAWVWVRNVTDSEYFTFLSAQPGGTGLIVGEPGDPRTVGVTFALRF